MKTGLPSWAVGAQSAPVGWLMGGFSYFTPHFAIDTWGNPQPPGRELRIAGEVLGYPNVGLEKAQNFAFYIPFAFIYLYEHEKKYTAMCC